MTGADHSSSTSDNKAILNRSSGYRSNGYDTISKSSKGDVYGDLTRIQSVLRARGTTPAPPPVPPASSEHAARYVFTHGDNFKTGYAPYSNEGHHMLPCEVFTDKYLTSKQILLVRKVDYDINNGDNIIFLPESEGDCDFHNLPSHCGSHPNYANLVSTDMQQARDSLQKEIDSDPNHENWKPPSDIPGMLKGFQDDYWSLLTTCGPMRINDVVRRANRIAKGKR